MRRHNYKRGYINLLLAWAIAKLETVKKYKTLGEIPEGVGEYGDASVLPDKPDGPSSQSRIQPV